MAKEEYLQVPTLSVDGSNWLYYKARVEWAVGSKGHTGHLSGLEAMPDDPSQGKDSSWKPTAAEQKLVSEYPAKFKEWTKDDNYVKQVIAVSIPESVTTVTPDQPCTTLSDCVHAFTACSTVCIYISQLSLFSLYHYRSVSTLSGLSSYTIT